MANSEVQTVRMQILELNNFDSILLLEGTVRLNEPSLESQVAPNKLKARPGPTLKCLTGLFPVLGPRLRPKI